jgi:hypothetical protein
MVRNLMLLALMALAPMSFAGEGQVACGEFTVCDANNPCQNGVECFALSVCPQPICIDAQAACDLECGTPRLECLVQESYPAKISCP